MKTLGILLINLIFLQNVHSQLIENFNDGDFSHNPVWKGDTSDFLINTESELQSQGPSISSEIYLYTEFNMSQNSIWEFYVRLDFPTSSSNYARFYLSSDNIDLSTNLNAYYVKLGGESGSDDGIDLYLQEGSAHSKIIDGIPGFFGKDSNEAYIKVIRSYEGEWSLWADTSLSGNYIFQGNNINHAIKLNNKLGMFCKHSATRNDKFNYDSISLRDGPFELINCTALNDSVLEVLFSNPCDSVSALNTNNYFITRGVSKPKSVYSYDSLPYRIFLEINNKLLAGAYALHVTNIKDRQDQIIQLDTANFNYFPSPLPSELIINEFMYDPNPVIGMPESEYLEILNISSQTINLKGVKYSDASSEISFPELLLDSGEYLIICDIKDTAQFNWFGDVLGLENWPTLNNIGDQLSLRSRDDQILDEVTYDGSWSDGSPKAEGGWSFERINPFKKCTDIRNWTYSVNGAGGTPGQVNSVFNPEPDILGPGLLSIEILSSQYLRLNFDEILNQNQFILNQFHFTPANQIEALLILENTIELSLQSPLDSGIINIVKIDSIYDCEGNLSSIDNENFGLGKAPEIFDLLINEIMYDPEPQNFLPASEYIELLNNSDDIISLNSVLAISDDDTSNLPAISIYPKKYLILCPSSKFEELSTFGNTIKLSPWLSLNNDEDQIRLTYQTHIIHEVNYSSDWITDSEKRDGGWSIEMIDPNNPCGEEYNWRASLDSKGGTPGKNNSNSSENPDLSPSQITGLDIVTSKSVRVFFNETVNLQNLHLSNLKIDPVIEIIDFFAESELSKNLTLYLSEELKPDINYRLDFFQFNDCVNNYFDLSINFILPENPDKQDLAINEVLFNPPTGASEFIEIYNRSPKNINLENSLLRYYGEDGQIRSSTRLSSQDEILRAFEFLVLCEDSNSITQYFPRHGNNYLEISGFPSLNNEAGTIAILDTALTIIDSITYSEKFHFDLIGDDKGVSLERISSDISGLQNDNWTSASETYNFASPGIANSKSIERINGEEQIIVQPSLFSPDGDGYKDLLHIQFNVGNPSAVASINIFDLNGRLIKNLANNFTLAYGNDFIWDGITDSGEKARIGNYIILVDLYDLDGNRNKIKKIVGLGGRI